MSASEEYMRARAWRALMADLNATPCEYPDLRDHFEDWLRDYQQRLDAEHQRSIRDMLGAAPQPATDLNSERQVIKLHAIDAKEAKEIMSAGLGAPRVVYEAATPTDCEGGFVEQYYCDQAELAAWRAAHQPGAVQEPDLHYINKSARGEA